MHLQDFQLLLLVSIRSYPRSKDSVAGGWVKAWDIDHAPDLALCEVHRSSAVLVHCPLEFALYSSYVATPSVQAHDIMTQVHL